MARQRPRTFWSLLFLIGGLVLVAVAGQSSRVAITESTTSPEPTTSPSPLIPSGAEPTEDPSAEPAGFDLVVLTSRGDTQQLVLVNPQTNSRRVIFTDVDENLKIKQVGNLSADGSEALVLMGSPSEEFGGQLNAIATDGSGRITPLISQFASPWPPMFSPDGKRIAYVFFSNVEAESGFFLVVANRNGTNKRELVRTAQPLTQPIFSPDGSQIAYITEESEGAAIMVVATRGGTPIPLAQLPQRVPYDLAWGPDGHFIFVDGTGDAADLFELSPDVAEPQRLTTPTGGESHPVVSPDGTQVAFTRTSDGENQIYLWDRAGQTAQLVGTGVLVVGWKERRVQ